MSIPGAFLWKAARTNRFRQTEYCHAGETEKLNNKTRHKICIKRAQEHNNGAEASINTTQKLNVFFFFHTHSHFPFLVPPPIQNWCTPCPTDSAVHQREIYILACETPPRLHPNLEIQSSVRQSGGEECVCAVCAFVNHTLASSTDTKTYNIWASRAGRWTLDVLRYSLFCGGDFIHQLVELCTAAIPLNREEVITVAPVMRTLFCLCATEQFVGYTQFVVQNIFFLLGES